MRNVVIEQTTSASLWKASNYRLVGGALTPDFIEATPDAQWARSDPFEYYSQVGHLSDESPPHEVYAKLAYMAEHVESTAKATERFHMAIILFVRRFGLLGWFGEEFGAPLLPKRSVAGFVRLAPDTVIDEDGRLRDIDPGTEGKHLQEQLMLHQAEEGLAQHGLPPPRPSNYILEPKELILPCELRFTRPPIEFVRTGFSRSAYYKRDNKTYTYEDVKSRYGIRIVFDPESSAKGAVVLPTREPVSMWQTLTTPGDQVSVSYLNRQLEEVRPLLVDGEDGSRTGGWACPSLLKAIHMMYYLDVVNRVEMKKCEAPGCQEYFRVGPRSRRKLYCPPPPGSKESPCASRASSAKYRERVRQRLDRA
jgi:hypothetical protein